MAIRTYECDKCGARVSEDVPMSDPARFKMIRGCTKCRQPQVFQRVFDPTYGTFGMYTRRYTGQGAAVKGWGTHNLDYGKYGSDLVAGRASEIATEQNGRVPQDTAKRFSGE